MKDVPPHCLAVTMRDCLASSCFFGSSIVFRAMLLLPSVVSHTESRANRKTDGNLHEAVNDFPRHCMPAKEALAGLEPGALVAPECLGVFPGGSNMWRLKTWGGDIGGQFFPDVLIRWLRASSFLYPAALGERDGNHQDVSTSIQVPSASSYSSYLLRPSSAPAAQNKAI